MQANKRDQKSNAKASAAAAKVAKQVEEAKTDNMTVERPASHASFSSSEHSQAEQIPAGKMHPLPKKPTTAFFLYAAENQSKLRNSRPDGTKHTITETAVELGNRWQLLSDKDKQKYQTLFEQDKARYQKQLEEVKTKGYFIMDDGQKSNQVLVSIPRKDKEAAKKVPTKTRGIQTAKDLFQEKVAEQVKSKTAKLEMRIEAEVQKRVKTLLKKRSRTPTSQSVKKVLIADASQADGKPVKRVKVLTSKTPQKSQSATKLKTEKTAEFGAKSHSRSKTPQKGQVAVKVKSEQTLASKQKSASGSKKKITQKNTQSATPGAVRSKQTKKRSQALAQAQ